MFRDANPANFTGIYIVCGYTDLRYGIDSLAAIIEKKYASKKEHRSKGKDAR